MPRAFGGGGTCAGPGASTCGVGNGGGNIGAARKLDVAVVDDDAAA